MNKKRILIVDDNQELRSLIRMTLEFNDYEIHEAEDGPHAMRLINVVKPDVVILDIMMPGEFDGLEVCKRVKSDAATADTKIILLSAMGQKKDVDLGLEAGANSYLTKPFSPLTLLDEV
jgi:DNA-binding response OmpR family regulator